MTVAIDPGPRPELAWLPVKLLSVDPAYQRTLESRRSQAAIEKIAGAFRWACFGTVMAAVRGDGWVVIDGQHRVEAARRVGLTTVPCIVVPADTVAEQARIFLATNSVRVAVNSYALYHARLAAGDERALATAALCAEAGLAIPRYPIQLSRLQPGQTLALGTLEKIANDENDRFGRGAVLAVSTAWRALPGGASSGLILAAAAALAERLDGRAALISWLGRQRPEQLELAYSGKGKVAALARAMIAGLDRERSRIPDPGDGFIARPTRAQLMGAR